WPWPRTFHKVDIAACVVIKQHRGAGARFVGPITSRWQRVRGRVGEDDIWSLFVYELRLGAGRSNRFSVATLFEIVRAEGRAGAALAQLLKLGDDFLSFFALAG